MGTSEGPAATLTENARARVRAVVYDANCFPEGRPVLSSLQADAELYKANGIELWVPEPVLFEWAEHLAFDYEIARHAASDERKRLRAAGVEPTWPFASANEVVDYVINEVTGFEGVVVVPLHPDDAREAVLDQLLQRGAATRKNGVKTGAADSAWLRGVYRHARRDFRRIVIVSRDRAAVERGAAILGTVPPARVARRAEVRDLLLLAQPLPLADVWALLTEFRRQFTLRLDDPHSMAREGIIDVSTFPAGDLSREAGGLVDEPLEEFVQNATLAEIYDIVGLTDVQRLRDDAVIATVYVLGSVAIATAGFNADGETLHEEDNYGGFLVTATLLLNLDANGRLLAAVNEDGDVSVRSPDGTVNSPRHGLLLLDEALQTVPGLEPPAWSPTDDAQWQRTLNGHDVLFRVEHDAHGWRAIGDVDGVTIATLTCRRNRLAAYANEQYLLEVEPVEWEGPNGPWSFAARICEAVARVR